jgi:hypothetical protein
VCFQSFESVFDERFDDSGGNMNKILERIERDAGVPGLVSILAEQIAPTDLKSVLLEVYRLRGERLPPSAVLNNYEHNRFVHPSSVSPAKLARWEQVAFSQLPAEFEAIALSPLCPLGGGDHPQYRGCLRFNKCAGIGMCPQAPDAAPVSPYFH